MQMVKAGFEVELDMVSVLFFRAEIFRMEKQPCEHTFRYRFHAKNFRIQFRLKNLPCEPSLTLYTLIF